ncbi:hypothetical protein VHEMI02560 [[Torrubiella] hemipterigena]|uniref:Pyridoxal-dependent decarboxylase n=1 Tax=[Torrubiella] hemipterigena TaxID=1531966 RepID=A0A0A1T8I7_9HYPO|nr:hypothetical protein VHEMI02560 [[Torrubiella] hemipterigena]
MQDDLFSSQHIAARVAHRSAASSAASRTVTDNLPTLPTQQALRAAEASLPNPSSAEYLAGQDATAVCEHIVRDIVPALNGQGSSARYYGFVTGGVLPVAEWADNVVSRLDQNVQVHLPEQTVATAVEDAALEMLVHVLGLSDGGQQWSGRTFTTGATASNVIGLACGREVSVANKAPGKDASVGELGLLAACATAGVSEIQVLTSAGHSSLYKAAGIMGIGRASVKELPAAQDQPWKLNLDALEAALSKEGTASIIAISAGDVNSGRFALAGKAEWVRVRKLADKYGAWIHVDGAFGIFGKVLPKDDSQYALIHERLEGIELADSITVDGHKLLNVPYDCGMFFTRSAATLQAVFTNPNAAYLSSSSAASIASPLNIGLENSRRFRALPAYAVLLSEGRPGLAALVGNMVLLARHIAEYLRDSPHYDLLPDEPASFDEVFMVTLFRAKDDALNQVLVDKINATRDVYVSGTSWAGRKAVRVAVSNWRVDVERDFAVVKKVLDGVAEQQ